jgi:glycosyltransferase involved in cell wall biosynthesis
MKKIPESISCILPAYNEEKNLEAAVKSCFEALERLFENFEIIIVDDGSDDGTKELAHKLAADDSRIKVVHHENNLGYGAALRSGFSAANEKLIFFTDSDGQFDPNEIEKLIPRLAKTDMVVGFRSQRADPPLRKIYGSLFSLIIRIIFGIQVRDINCAFKIFRKSIIDGVTLESPGALVNAELLIIARQKGITPIEVPVSHFPRKHGQQTGGSLKVVFRAGMELIALFYRFRVKSRS